MGNKIRDLPSSEDYETRIKELENTIILLVIMLRDSKQESAIPVYLPLWPVTSPYTPYTIPIYNDIATDPYPYMPWIRGVNYQSYGTNT